MTRLPDPDKLPAPTWLAPVLAAVYAVAVIACGVAVAQRQGWLS